MKVTTCESMDGPIGYYTTWNKSDRESQIPYNFTYVWNLKNKINEQQNRNKLIDRTNWWLPDGKGIGVLGERGEEIKKYILAIII